VDVRTTEAAAGGQIQWPVLRLLAAGVPVTLLADLFPVHGPDSEHIYRHEPATGDLPADGEPAGALVGARPAY
jgi:hypothetical protein